MQPDPVAQISSHTLVRLVLLLVLLVIGLFVLYSFQERPDTSNRLHGIILVTSTASSSAPFLDTYAIDLKDHSLTAVGSDDTSDGMMYSLSADDSKVAFVGVTAQSIADANKRSDPGSAFQIYESAMTGSAVPVPTAGSAVTANSVGKMTPAISDDGSSVLYVSPTTQTASSTSVSSYDIHLVTTSGTTSRDVVVTHGIQPRWFSNTAFYYVAPDGVRLWNLSAKASALALPAETGANVKLAVSPDKRYLAVSIPDARKVFVFTTSQNGDYLTSIGQGIDMFGYWIVFSPDSSTMAIQTAQDTTNDHPSLVFYDPATLAQISGSVGLDPLLNDQLFVTGWYY